MADLSITAASATFTLVIPGLFDQPQTLQGYATDDVFRTETVESVQIEMGVDGLMSAGYVPMPVTQTIQLQANSPSIALFEQWYAAMQTAREVFFANGVFTFISVQSKYNMRKGVLRPYSPMPDAGKILKPRTFGLTWESITGAPTGFGII